MAESSPASYPFQELAGEFPFISSKKYLFLVFSIVLEYYFIQFIQM